MIHNQMFLLIHFKPWQNSARSISLSVLSYALVSLALQLNADPAIQLTPLGTIQEIYVHDFLTRPSTITPLLKGMVCPLQQFPQRSTRQALWSKSPLASGQIYEQLLISAQLQTAVEVHTIFPIRIEWCVKLNSYGNQKSWQKVKS